MRRLSVEEVLEKAGITESEFIHFYTVEHWSLVDFKTQKGIPYKQTQKILEGLGIPRRNISESQKTQKFRAKVEKSLEEKYGKGVKNASQAQEVKDKKAATFTKNYGIDNIWKTKEYCVKLHETMLEKYGAKSVPNLHGNANPFGIKNLTESELEERMGKAHEGFKKYWDSLTDEQKNEVIQKRSREIVKHYDSSLERKIKQGLDNLKIKYKDQFWIKRKSYDFLLTELRIIVEVQGDFWHANPALYKGEDILNHPGNKISAQEIWNKDLEKKQLAESHGNRMVYFWETELKGLTQPETMALIIERIFPATEENK